MSIQHSWLKAPLADSIHRFLVKSETDGACESNVPGMTIGSDHDLEHYDSLKLHLACLFRVLGLGVIDGLWSTHTAAYDVWPSAIATAPPVADSRTSTGSNASPTATANSAPTADSIRRRADNS